MPLFSVRSPNDLLVKNMVLYKDEQMKINAVFKKSLPIT